MKINRSKFGLIVLGYVILVTSVPVQQELSPQLIGLSPLKCLKPRKTAKPLLTKVPKRFARLSRKKKLWKLGNAGFPHSQYCGLDEINPLAIGDLQFHLKSELNEKAHLLLSSREEVINTGVGRAPAGLRILASESGAATEFIQLANRMRYAKTCEKRFIAGRGFGPLGKVVKEALTKSSAKTLLSREIYFGGACPAYQFMNREQKKNFWVFVMMSMSHYESSCQDEVLNNGPHGVAVGLLQLHHESEDLYVGRDPDSSCDKGASRDAQQSIRCGLTMIDNQVDEGMPFFSNRSHWQVLRNVDRPGTHASLIRYALSQIPDCGANPMVFEQNLHNSKNEVPQAGYRKAAHGNAVVTLRQ